MLYILKQIAKTGRKTEPAPAPDDDMVVVARLQEKVLRTLGRALTIRQVDAGSCNGCELEIHALANPYYNIEGLGIKFVASPRHADALLVTGPVTKHMAIALERTYAATPEPKLVIAAGECACGRGIFGEGYATIGSVDKLHLTTPGVVKKNDHVIAKVIMPMNEPSADKTGLKLPATSSAAITNSATPRT